jgi:hypothetical protein
MLTWSFGWTGVFEPSLPPRISILRFEITCSAIRSSQNDTRKSAHLVHVHVRLSTRAGLEDDKREVGKKFPRNNLHPKQGVRTHVYLTNRNTTKEKVETLASSAACWIASLTVLSSPYLALTLAAAFLRTPNAFMSGSGILSCSPPMSKFWSDLVRRQSL